MTKREKRQIKEKKANENYKNNKRIPKWNNSNKTGKSGLITVSILEMII